MKVREIATRCLKARFVSWITMSQTPVIVPTLDGGGCIVAVYSNGRYVVPQIVHIPNGVPDNWGPDGPIQEPPAPPAEGGPDNDHPSAG